MGSLQEQPQWLITATEKRRLQTEALLPFLPKREDDGAALLTPTSLIPHDAKYGTCLDKSWIEPRRAREITDIDDIEVLRDRIAAGELTAAEVIDAYTRRAAAAHRVTNALTEVCFSDALKQARELDQYYAAHKKPIGPLHGVPITLKDQFNVKGCDTTLGYVGRAFNPATEDAVVVSILKNLGAVVLAKTNIPQSIMWCETENPLWGLTTNPQDPEFTPGGSTGGEGCLLALHGSLVGFGTDIGGSIRIPSHMLGLYGLKPSSTRLPYHGVPVSTEGQEHVPSVIGPLARSLSSLTLITKSIIDSTPWRSDAKCVPIPWRDEAYQEMSSRPLTIGLLVDDGVVKVHPPIERVLREVADKLAAAGHDIVPWHASGHKECIAIMDQFYSADGGEDVRRDVLAGGEPFIPHVEALVNRGPAISVYEYWQLNRQKLAAQKSYLDKWNSILSPKTGKPVDVLLMPTMPHLAVPHRCCKWVGYTKVWNFLDYSAISIPAGKCQLDIDDGVVSYEGRNDPDKWNWSVWEKYKDRMDGYPVSVQVVARRLEEERVLGAAKAIEEVIQKS